MSSNPFFELYVGDRISSEEFVTVFSPFLVKHAEAIFVPGNVVVTGMQGSGKSMLLSLLKPSVRVEYAKAGKPFPIPQRFQKFVGAGINLAHSNAIDFGYRRVPGDLLEASLLFGDFVNYSICLDLIHSVTQFGQLPQHHVHATGVISSPDLWDRFTKKIQKDPTWQGYLEESTSFEDLVERMRERTFAYRRFLHMNDIEFDEKIRSTKTPVGGPILAVVRTMKEIGILEKAVNVFVHIDQYEELANLGTGVAGDIDYRAVINRALASRDPNVSYRIGSRGYAWHSHGKILGTGAKLEEERDYKFVDLDEKLRRHENPKTWIFPGFAEDVFARRLNHAGFDHPTSPRPSLLEKLFGYGLSPEDKAKKYAGRNRRRVVKPDVSWPHGLQAQLFELADVDPFAARLGEAWAYQKGLQELSLDKLPWDQPAQQWWRKERIEIALIQIASRCQQRPLWSGVEDIINLSGGNILIFLSICQCVWDALLQVGDRRSERDALLKEVEPEIQAIGILRASEHWLKKISQETGRSGDRFRFVREVGEMLSRDLMHDRRLSNPGHNGFSVADEELEQLPDLRGFLQELSDYGNMLQFKHTTKEKDRRSRQKWYLNPIFDPQFKLPFKRLKEPRYVRAVDVQSWLENSRTRQVLTQIGERGESPEDLPLFRRTQD